MKFFNPILIALSLTALLSGCASSMGPAAEKPSATKTESEGNEFGEEDSGASSGGSRVCGWSDTGRWVCSGPAPSKKPTATAPSVTAPSVGGTSAIEKSAPARKPKRPPAKKSESTGLGNSPKASDLETDPIEE